MADQNPAEKAKDKMEGLEKSLDKHSDKLPGLSQGNKDMVANFLPWGAGAFGALVAFWVLDLYDYVSSIGDVTGALGEFGSLLAASLPSKGATWVGILILAAAVVFIAMSFMRGISSKTRAGWNFMFYGMVASVLGGIYYVFMLGDLNSGRGWVITLVGLAGLYGIFQVKDAFKS